MACALFMLALALLLYLAAAEMFGPTAGLFALALLAFDPNFLAHSALVTTDVGSSFFFLAAIYAFYRHCKHPTMPRLLTSGVVAGFLLATKFTGIFLLPMLLLCVLLEWAITRSSRILWQRLAAVAAISVIAWIVLWSFYGFRYKSAPEGRELNPALNAYLAKMYDQPAARKLAIVAHNKVLPEAYSWGLENTKNTEFEDNSYFWGHVYRHGNRAYFPVAFLIKSTLPFLILLCLTPVAWKWGLRNKPRELAFLLIPVAVYLAVSIHSDMDIGLRHLLPVYAFLYLLIAGTSITLCFNPQPTLAHRTGRSSLLADIHLVASSPRLHGLWQRSLGRSIACPPLSQRLKYRLGPAAQSRQNLPRRPPHHQLLVRLLRRRSHPALRLRNPLQTLAHNRHPLVARSPYAGASSHRRYHSDK